MTIRTPDPCIATKLNYPGDIFASAKELCTIARRNLGIVWRIIGLLTALASTNGKNAMPLFLIERNFAEDVALTDDDAAQIRQVNDEIGVQWLYSFLSADKRKSYCLYEAPNAEAILASAKRLNVPADVIIPVGELRPEQFAGTAAVR